MTPQVSLSLLPERYAVCRLPAGAPIPDWCAGDFASVTRTGNELSIVCPENNIPEDITTEKGWRCLKVAGPLDFSMVGVLASLTAPLAEAGISVFAISTYDTDYLLIKEEGLEKTKTALYNAGHSWHLQGGI